MKGSHEAQPDLSKFPWGGAAFSGPSCKGAVLLSGKGPSFSENSPHYKQLYLHLRITHLRTEKLSVGIGFALGAFSKEIQNCL